MLETGQAASHAIMLYIYFAVAFIYLTRLVFNTHIYATMNFKCYLEIRIGDRGRTCMRSVDSFDEVTANYEINYY